MTMKITILGAGAMGCLYGAAFHRAGAQVTFVDVNAAHVEAINARGLELDTRRGVELLPIPALLPQQVTEVADLIVVFTKTFHTEGALAGIRHAIGKDTHLLSLQNGLGNDRKLAGVVGDERVMVGASMLPSDLVGPGKVRSHGEGGTKLYPAFGSDPAFAAQLTELLSKGDLAASLEPDIHAAVWSKAIFNAAMNPRQRRND